MMVTRPQTEGYGLTDSPVGLAAWMYDKFAAWTYSDGHPERVLTKDEMLDDITLYWVTNTAVSSSRLYWENNANNFNAVSVSIPAAITVFPVRSTRLRGAGPQAATTSSSTSTKRARAVTSLLGKFPTSSPMNSGPRSGRCATRGESRENSLAVMLGPSCGCHHRAPIGSG